jgi:Ca2+-binding RTX toxin-like protein
MKIKGTKNNDDGIDRPRLAGTAGHDRIYGRAGDDFLAGLAGDDRLYGGTGGDILVGGGPQEDAGADHLFGGAGNDLIRAGLGDDFINGGGGIDRVSFFINVVANPSVTSGVTVSLAIVGKAQDTGYGLKKIVGIEHLSGTAYADRLTGNSGSNWLLGGGGNDVYFGLAGNDLITVASGQEYVDGGSGTDSVNLAGNGTVSGPVSVSLALQNSWQATGQGSLFLTSVENLSGTAYNDSLRGDGGANVLAGWDGSDTLVGGGGNDRLLGDGEIATFGPGPSGGAVAIMATGAEDPVGNDILIGGAGADRLNGGPGADNFVYLSVGDSTISAPDRLEDFRHSEADLIDLAAIDAKSATGADEAFTFVGSAAFTGTAGELRVSAVSGGFMLLGDVNGDASADFAIMVASPQPLVVQDLVL